MALEVDFKELCPHSITRAPFSSQDKFGKVTFGAGTAFSARVLTELTKVMDASGQEKMAETTVWIYGNPSFDVRDKITLPDATTPPILRIERFPDMDGAHHEKLYLGGAR